MTSSSLQPTGQTASLAPLRGNYVMLKADSLCLMMPQEDVGVAEYLDNVAQAAQPAGRFERDGSAYQLVALSEQMRPLDVVPAERFVLTGVPTAKGDLFLAWNEVRVMINVNLECVALPAAMQWPGAPISSYVRIDGRLAFCCSAERLLSYAFSGAH